MQRAEVVLASNRGPVSFVEHDGAFDIKRGAGGLAGALDPVSRRLGSRAMWIAAAVSDADRNAVGVGAASSLDSELGYPVELISIDPGTYAAYYDRISNRMLWFANHDLWDDLGIEGFDEHDLAAWGSAYIPVNERFARVISESGRDDALVLCQDYHLALTPRLLRQAGSRQTILHFTHSSFSDKGLLRLPERIARAVVEGMQAADLVGFHTRAWADAFLRACETFGMTVDHDAGSIEAQGRRAWVRCYPISVDATDLRDRATGPAARDWALRLRRRDDELLVVRADRAEPSKNIVRGFEAWGVLLDRREDLRTRARFVACLYPSRTSMPEYAAYADRIRDIVGSVVQRHPDSVELFMSDDFDRSLGALATYDVLLVNSVMDGMNLVSKEGPVVNERAGAVVLSRWAGSFQELGDRCVEIDDPRDVTATAAALEAALDLPAGERARRARELEHRVRANRPEDWITPQLEDLESVRSTGEPKSPF